MAKATADLSYCGREVRKYDNDRFVTALLAPSDTREALFTLYAFNLEIAKTREVVTEPVLGQMRLQFWRDGIEALYEGRPVPKHAVMEPLAETVRQRELARAPFDRLIDARESDLTDEPPDSLSCLVNYAEVTSAPLVQIALDILGVRSEAADRVARHVGIAYALTGILRAAPFLAARHRTMLPTDRMEAHGARTSDLFELRSKPALKAVVAEVAGAAREHLAQARLLRAELPRKAVPALLPAVLSDIYLDVIAREGNDIFAPRVQMPNPFRQMKLAWAVLRGRY